MKKVIILLALFSTTVLAQQKGSFTDTRDKKTYKTVKIGEQVWMAENLNYNAESSRCYEDKESNCKKYGRLYDWETAMKACPLGWHLPSNEEWQILEVFVGGNEIAGQKLKARNGWEKWDCEYTEVDDRGRTTKKSKCNSDSYGFSALPGGLISNDDFNYVGYNGSWWCSSDTSITDSYRPRLGMSYSYADIGRGFSYKSSLYSVRCLQN